MFKNLFGGKKDKKKPTVNVDEAIKNLDKKINDMELLINNLETRQKNLQEEAKQKLRAGDKNGAKRILAKKKKLVDQMKNYEGALMMMEEQKGMLENSSATKGMIDAIKQATNVIKENKVDVAELDDIREQMEDQKMAQEEMNDFFKDYANEAEEGVEDDLKELEDQILEEESKNLPSAVKTEIEGDKVKTTNEEKALEEFMI